MNVRLTGLCPACGGDRLFVHWVSDEAGIIECDNPDCPSDTLVQELLAKPDQHLHLIQFREDGYTVQHPLAERIRPESLFACDLADDFRALTEPPGLGYFRVPPGSRLANAEPVPEGDVLFEVPAAPPSPEVERQSILEGLPIGTVTGHQSGTEPAEGFVELLAERQPVPADCVALLAYATAVDTDWTHTLANGDPALPSLDDMGWKDAGGDTLIIRVK